MMPITTIIVTRIKNGHKPPGTHEVGYLVAGRPHDQGIDLVGADEEGVGGGNGHGEGEHRRVRALCADGDIHRQGYRQTGETP